MTRKWSAPYLTISWRKRRRKQHQQSLELLSTMCVSKKPFRLQRIFINISLHSISILMNIYVLQKYVKKFNFSGSEEIYKKKANNKLELKYIWLSFNYFFVSRATIFSFSFLLFVLFCVSFGQSFCFYVYLISLSDLSRPALLKTC